MGGGEGSRGAAVATACACVALCCEALRSTSAETAIAGRRRTKDMTPPRYDGESARRPRWMDSISAAVDAVLAFIIVSISPWSCGVTTGTARRRGTSPGHASRSNASEAPASAPLMMALGGLATRGDGDALRFVLTTLRMTAGREWCPALSGMSASGASNCGVTILGGEEGDRMGGGLASASRSSRNASSGPRTSGLVLRRSRGVSTCRVGLLPEFTVTVNPAPYTLPATGVPEKRLILVAKPFKGSTRFNTIGSTHCCAVSVNHVPSARTQRLSMADSAAGLDASAGVTGARSARQRERRGRSVKATQAVRQDGSDDDTESPTTAGVRRRAETRDTRAMSDDDDEDFVGGSLHSRRRAPSRAANGRPAAGLAALISELNEDELFTGDADRIVPGSKLTEAQFAALPDAEQKKQRRLVRNRQSAQLHRQRQRMHIDMLEQQVAELCGVIDVMRDVLKRAAASGVAVPPALLSVAGPSGPGMLGFTGVAAETALAAAAALGQLLVSDAPDTALRADLPALGLVGIRFLGPDQAAPVYANNISMTADTQRAASVRSGGSRRLSGGPSTVTETEAAVQPPRAAIHTVAARSGSAAGSRIAAQKVTTAAVGDVEDQARLIATSMQRRTTRPCAHSGVTPGVGGRLHSTDKLDVNVDDNPLFSPPSGSSASSVHSSADEADAHLATLPLTAASMDDDGSTRQLKRQRHPRRGGTAAALGGVPIVSATLPIDDDDERAGGLTQEDELVAAVGDSAEQPRSSRHDTAAAMDTRRAGGSDGVAPGSRVVAPPNIEITAPDAAAAPPDMPYSPMLVGLEEMRREYDATPPPAPPKRMKHRDPNSPRANTAATALPRYDTGGPLATGGVELALVRSGGTAANSMVQLVRSGDSAATAGYYGPLISRVNSLQLDQPAFTDMPAAAAASGSAIGVGAALTIRPSRSGPFDTLSAPLVNMSPNAYLHGGVAPLLNGGSFLPLSRLESQPSFPATFYDVTAGISAKPFGDAPLLLADAAPAEVPSSLPDAAAIDNIRSDIVDMLVRDSDVGAITSDAAPGDLPLP